ncbi:tRNA (adenosine(37)-N6)-threonylcarbamoyltransferase complex ATPase subunit type 1 TsaE [Candidatus Pelagibacter sp.]|nr:tRNA (adenosine(37)-N6)-threonylcarbamoyltransferase complex ATPase subunit type 1 TsaE [Candidatus Pelagibacter sp.]
MPIATKSDFINLSSEKKTEELAEKISKKLKLGHVVFLVGEMGVGKTTFIRYLINNFQKQNGLKITEVTSPTFNLLNEYQIKQIKINHYDLFRINSLDEIHNLGLFDDITHAITLIEWPQKIKPKPKNLIELNFEYGNDYKKRKLKIKGLNL